MHASLARPLVVAAVIALFLATGCAGRPAPEAPTAPAAEHGVWRVQAALLNLLECPTVSCQVVEDLRNGQEVTVLTPDLNGWVQIRVLPSGPEGYVQSRFLRRK